MDIELSVLRFIGLLGIEFAFIIAAFLAMLPVGIFVTTSGHVRGWHLAFNAILFETVSVGFIVLCIWVLTGVFYATLILVSVSLVVAAVSVAALVWLIIGSPNVTYPGRIIWSQYEFQQLWPRTKSALDIASMTPLLIFPVFIGFTYFGNVTDPDAWKRFVFESTILVIMGISWLAMLPRSLYTIVSENVLGPTRARILINQVAHSASVVLYLSLYVWATTDIGGNAEQLGSVLILSRELTALIVGYVVLFIVLPFVVGHYRAKHRIETLQSARDKRISEFIAALGSPSIDQVEQRLAILGAGLQQDITELESGDSIRLAESVINSPDDNPANLVPKIGLRDSMDRDPRFIHLFALEEIGTRLNELKAAISDCETVDEQRAAIDITAAEMQRVLEQGYVKPSTASAWAVGVMSSVGTALVTPIWSTVTQYLLGLIGIEPQ